LKQHEGTEWEDLRQKVRERDGHCRLITVLSAREFLILQKNARAELTHCDPAHVFGKGAFPHMKYLVDNVILLNRYSHTMMDSCCDPINGKMISRETRNLWWERMIGKEAYTNLLEESQREL